MHVRSCSPASFASPNVSSRSGVDKRGGDFVQKWVSRDFLMRVQVVTLVSSRRCMQSASFVLHMLFLVGNNDFAVFPGSYVPSYPYLSHLMNTTSDGRFTTDSVSNIGPHCARTFREWKKKFLRNFNFSIVPFLKGELQLDDNGIEWFKRKWTCECDLRDSFVDAKLLYLSAVRLLVSTLNLVHAENLLHIGHLSSVQRLL